MCVIKLRVKAKGHNLSITENSFGAEYIIMQIGIFKTDRVSNAQIYVRHSIFRCQEILFDYDMVA